MRKSTVATYAAIFFILIISPAIGQDKSGDWRFELAPYYLWGVSIDADQTVKGQEVDLDVPFSEIFDSLSGVFTGHLDVSWKQKWGGWVDVSWIDLEGDTQSLGLTAITPEFEQTLVEFAGYYRLNRNVHDFDFFVGIRYSDMEVTLEFSGLPPDLEGSANWVDPFIGVRWLWRFADQWRLLLRGDIGGFDVGSDITGNAVGLITYKPWKHVAIVGGYRALYQDYEDGSGPDLFIFDGTMHGPIMGLDIVW